jgi:threonine dehydratase
MGICAYPDDKMIHEAATRIRPYLPITPLRNYPLLDEWIGHRITLWLKHENHQPTNSFKIRNAMAALTGLSCEERQLGVLAASTGNHGLALAWGGRTIGTPVEVYVPIGTAKEKIAAMRGYGATVVEIGNIYDDALNSARLDAAHGDRRLIEATDNTMVLAGAATLFFEILTQMPQIDVAVVSVGGGSHAAGAIVARDRSPGHSFGVVGVQAEQAPAICRSWEDGIMRRIPSKPTLAEGLATSVPYDATFPILLKGFLRMITVDEEEILEAARVTIVRSGNLVEPSGVVGVAGVKHLASELSGKTIVTVISGSNPSIDTLQLMFGNRRFDAYQETPPVGHSLKEVSHGRPL